MDSTFRDAVRKSNLKSSQSTKDRQQVQATPDMFYKKEPGDVETEDLAASKDVAEDDDKNKSSSKKSEKPKNLVIAEELIDDDNIISAIEVDEDEERADVDSVDFDKNSNVLLKGKDRQLG